MRRTVFLLRWSLRDLRHRWVLVATLALVVALATGVGAGLGSMHTWRDRSNDKSFALLHLHHLRVSLAGESYLPSGTLAAAVRRSSVGPGVAALQERLVVPTQVDASTAGRTILVPGGWWASRSLVLARSSTAASSSAAVTCAGQMRRSVAVVEGNFAEHHSLPVPTRAHLARRAAARARRSGAAAGAVPRHATRGRIRRRSRLRRSLRPARNGTAPQRPPRPGQRARAHAATRLERRCGRA